MNGNELWVNRVFVVARTRHQINQLHNNEDACAITIFIPTPKGCINILFTLGLIIPSFEYDHQASVSYFQKKQIRDY